MGSWKVVIYGRGLIIHKIATFGRNRETAECFKPLGRKISQRDPKGKKRHENGAASWPAKGYNAQCNWVKAAKYCQGLFEFRLKETIHVAIFAILWCEIIHIKWFYDHLRGLKIKDCNIEQPLYITSGKCFHGGNCFISFPGSWRFQCVRGARKQTCGSDDPESWQQE